MLDMERRSNRCAVRVNTTVLMGETTAVGCEGEPVCHPVSRCPQLCFACPSGVHLSAALLMHARQALLHHSMEATE